METKIIPSRLIACHVDYLHNELILVFVVVHTGGKSEPIVSTACTERVASNCVAAAD